MSVKKMVQPTGRATATMFFVRPLDMNPSPISEYRLATVARNPWCVLNCSFRITSNGFVSAAPAIPATPLLIADLARRSVSYDDEDGSGWAKRFSMMSFVTMAVQYFGTV